MSQSMNPTLSEAKKASILKKLDELLVRFRENNRATREIYKDIEKLKRSNEISFRRARKAVEALAKY